MKNDPGIEWIRKMRHRISEECDHDPLKLVEYYMKQDKQENPERFLKEDPACT